MMDATYTLPFDPTRTKTIGIARGMSPPMFERLIYYMLAPDLFARIVLEAGLNMSPLVLVQPKLWVFYLLMLGEYTFQSLTLGHQRFRINASNIVFLLVMTMAIHGVVVGLYWGNKIPKLMTDTIPVVVTGLNIALLNRDGAFRGFDFRRLVKVVMIFCTVMVSVGIISQLTHRSGVPSLGGAGSTPICLTVILVYLNMKERLTVLDLMWVSFIIAPAVPTTNRTTLLVFSLAFLVFVMPHIFRNARQLYFSLFFFGSVIVAFMLFVPADSQLMARINGSIQHVTQEKSEESGSIYERQAEWEAIKKKLSSLGPAAEYFGYGAGGTYIVQFSFTIPENYSHAHFSWSLFRLRYGYVGYFYLGVFASFLLYSCLMHLLRPDPLSRIVTVLNMWCMVFLFTYVFFNFLAAGLQFADTDDPQRDDA